MEGRIAKLESDMEHVKGTCDDIKVDIRRIGDKLDKVKDSVHSAKIWALVLYAGLFVALGLVLMRLMMDVGRLLTSQ